MRGLAFCPAHITGFFKADVDRLEPEKMGSLGAGFSIKDGVTSRVNIEFSDENKFEIKTNGYETDNTDVSEFVIKEFQKISDKKFYCNVVHDISIPIGYGLGCSGAVALSLAYALNQALGTNLNKEEIGKIAHKAEVSCKTGLGDVIGSFYGGFEIRTKPGAPGIGELKKINADSSVIIACFSPISTKKFIDEKLEVINGLGGKMVNKLIQTSDYNEFQDMSVEFAKYVKVMTPKMDSIISELNNIGVKCGVALFGETIFSLVPKEKEIQVLKILKKYDDNILIQSQIDNVGARLQ
ncbi:MAG TPA: GHMP kinase [Nitrosopumilaceae archaeon]|nr:GHMP kinase [Nitrosopumilaceae archaeon]